MFFYISGMASTFFNTEGKGFGLFFLDKVLRLLIPFGIAIFIFLMPRLYLGQEYEDWTRPNGQTGNGDQGATCLMAVGQRRWLVVGCCTGFTVGVCVLCDD